MTKPGSAHWFGDYRLAPGGVEVEVCLDEAERANLARELGLLSVEKAAGSFRIRSGPGGSGMRVSGRVLADIRQECVVSFEPVAQSVDEKVDIEYRPARRGSSRADTAAESIDVEVDPDERRELERYSEGGIDLAQLIREFILVGLDPYPRAPGVDFTQTHADEPETRRSPFEALASLRGEDDKK